MKKIIFAIALFSAAFFNAEAQILPSFGDSRTGTTGLQFLKIGPDARSAGMAGSYIAVVDDVTALFWNPAGITQVDTQSLHIAGGHAQYFASIDIQHLGIVKQLGGDTYLGASMVYLNTGDMAVTTEFQPFGTGETFRAVDMAVGLAFAARLTDNFSFGAVGKYVYEGIADVTTNTFLFDFGFQYNVGIANTRFAVGISNFGFNAEPTGEIEVLTLNGTTTVTEFEQVSAPAVFRLGFAWDAIEQDIHKLTLAAQLNHPTDNNETFSLGTEYSWHRLFFARAGYEFGADEGGLPAFGFGLHVKRNFGALKIDYGFSNKKILGTAHRITLGISLL